MWTVWASPAANSAVDDTVVGDELCLENELFLVYEYADRICLLFSELMRDAIPLNSVNFI